MIISPSRLGPLPALGQKTLKIPWGTSINNMSSKQVPLVPYFISFGLSANSGSSQQVPYIGSLFRLHIHYSRGYLSRTRFLFTERFIYRNIVCLFTRLLHYDCQYLCFAQKWRGIFLLYRLCLHQHYLNIVSDKHCVTWKDENDLRLDYILCVSEEIFISCPKMFSTYWRYHLGVYDDYVVWLRKSCWDL